MTTIDQDVDLDFEDDFEDDPEADEFLEDLRTYEDRLFIETFTSERVGEIDFGYDYDPNDHPYGWTYD